MQKFFITSTGTGIGKTLITTALCHQFKADGKKVSAIKPIISGYSIDDLNSDTALILQSCSLPVTQENIEKTSPWRFTAPLSPDMAAAREGKKILLEDIVSFCKQQEKTDMDILLVEGVGGVCVPLNSSHTILDLMAALDYKIILVCGSYLGSLSHTLTAIHSLAARNLKPYALIISESEESPVTFAENFATLSNFLPAGLPIINVPRLDKNAKNMPDLTSMYL